MVGDPSVGPYDGADDTLVGVVNNSRSSVPAITVTGKGTGLSLLDGDGLCTFVSGGCPYGPTGYEGPGTTLVTNPALPDSAEVDFSGTGLARGASTYFSLEGDLTAAQVVAVRGALEPKNATLTLKTSASLAPFPAGQDPGVAAYVRYTLTATYSDGTPAANAAVNLSNAAHGVTFHTNSLGVLSLLEPVSIEKKQDLKINATVAATNGARASATQTVYTAEAQVRCKSEGYPGATAARGLEALIGNVYLAEIQDVIDFLASATSKVNTTTTGYQIQVPGSPSFFAADFEVKTKSHDTPVYEEIYYGSHVILPMPSPLDLINSGFNCGVPS